MIVFDTNAVNLLSPESPTADIIRKLRRSGHHRVAVPWMVLEELAAHQAELYPDKYRAVVNTLARLREVLPWDLKSSLEPLDVERLLNHWRGVYGEIFEVIETSGEAARRALAREAMHLPPAKRAKDHSEGARDVAIWFSVLDLLKSSPSEHVYLVTNNSNDFGDGTTFPYPMDEDLRGMEGRLTLLRDFNQVVSQFTETVPGDAAVAAAEQLLSSDAVREHIAKHASEVLNSPIGYEGLDKTDTVVRWTEWIFSPDVELLEVGDVTGHRIEGEVWYTAEARWLLHGHAVTVAEEAEEDGDSVACAWKTKILFSTADKAMEPTIVKDEEPEAPAGSDERCMEVLRSLRRAAEVAARSVVRRLKYNSGLADAFAASRALDKMYGQQAAAAAIAKFAVPPDFFTASRVMEKFYSQQASTVAAMAAKLSVSPNFFTASRAFGKAPGAAAVPGGQDSAGDGVDATDPVPEDFGSAAEYSPDESREAPGEDS
jgi:hypothetical protein